VEQKEREALLEQGERQKLGKTEGRYKGEKAIVSGMRFQVSCS
jgi:hypothetical protein